jgi:hypothetical protein
MEGSLFVLLYSCYFCHSNCFEIKFQNFLQNKQNFHLTPPKLNVTNCSILKEITSMAWSSYYYDKIGLLQSIFHKN